jgi:TPR repeat protein
MYQKGINMEQDPSEAAKWYRKAAKQADKDPKHAQTAQTHLSEMLAAGMISAADADWHQAEPPALPPTTTPNRTKPNPPPPFSFGEVETGLAGGITNKRMATLVGTYGVDFTLNSGSRKRLSDQGADDGLLAAIASAKR